MESTIDQLMAIARGDYGDYHKLLAQTLLKEAVFENLKISDFFFEILKLFEPEFRHVHLSRRERETLQEVLIHKMNDELSYVFFHIVRVTDEYEEDHRSYYAMISDMPFNESFAANVGGFTKQQMGLFDMWLQLMYVTSSNKDGRIEVDQALNAIDMMQYTMPKKQIQDVIHKMISEKWLIDEEGMLRLHPRALAELRQVLKSEPFLVPVCATCQNLISNLPTGIKCSCGRIVHKHCFETVQGAGSGTDFRCDCGNVLQSSQNAEIQESSESGGSAQENDED